MIVNEEYLPDLLNIANRLKFARHSVPTDENGEPTETYLEYLSLMYNSEIAKIVQHLDIFPDMMSIVKFAKKVNIDKKELIEKLEDIAKKGFVVNLGRLYAIPSPTIVLYIPFVFERTYKSKDAKKFAELGIKYIYEEGYYKKYQTQIDGTPRKRILTVSEEINPGHGIIPSEEVYSIIDQYNDFAVVPCPCRHRAEIAGIRKCKDKYPLHNCILLGPYALAVLQIEDPVVRAISKEEAKKLAREASEIGLVHTTDNITKNCRTLCSCCECCCQVIGGLTRLDNPRAVGKANYIAIVDKDTCVGCGTCIERCKFGAITVNEVSKINTDKCMGCGLCAVTCPEDAIAMKRFEREEIPLERNKIEIVE